MRHLFRGFCILGCFLLLAGCTRDTSPLATEPDDFAIYFLSDPQLGYDEISSLPLNDLPLASPAIATARDIEMYTIFYINDNPIRSHLIKFKPHIRNAFGDSIRPFVVVANGARMYSGEYWPAMTGIFPRGNLLVRMGDRFDLIPAQEKGNAEINDPRIIGALLQAGVQIEYVNIGN